MRKIQMTSAQGYCDGCASWTRTSLYRGEDGSTGALCVTCGPTLQTGIPVPVCSQCGGEALGGFCECQPGGVIRTPLWKWGQELWHFGEGGSILGDNPWEALRQIKKAVGE